MPNRAEELKYISAKKRYKHYRHKLRWTKRYKRTYSEIVGEIGTFEGVKFING